MIEPTALIRLTLRLLLTVVTTVLIAPWIAGALLAAGARVVRHALRAYRAGGAAFTDFVHCPRGHRSELHGVFECRCGALFAGWAFERCPVCNESCGWTGCEHCGLAVRNPVLVALLAGRSS